jgi:hypothetical protein
MNTCFTDQFKWIHSKDFSGQLIPIFNGQNPSEDNYDLASSVDLGENGELKNIFTAREMATCPNYNINYEQVEHVAIIYQIGQKCLSWIQQSDPAASNRAPKPHFRKVLSKKANVALIGKG